MSRASANGQEGYDES